MPILADSLSSDVFTVMASSSIWLISRSERSAISSTFWLGNTAINSSPPHLPTSPIGPNMAVRSAPTRWSSISPLSCPALSLIALNPSRSIKTKIKCCSFCTNPEMDSRSELRLERPVNSSCNASWRSLASLRFLSLMSRIVAIK